MRRNYALMRCMQKDVRKNERWQRNYEGGKGLGMKWKREMKIMPETGNQRGAQRKRGQEGVRPFRLMDGIVDREEPTAGAGIEEEEEEEAGGRGGGGRVAGAGLARRPTENEQRNQKERQRERAAWENERRKEKMEERQTENSTGK